VFHRIVNMCEWRTRMWDSYSRLLRVFLFGHLHYRLCICICIYVHIFVSILVCVRLSVSVRRHFGYSFVQTGGTDHFEGVAHYRSHQTNTIYIWIWIRWDKQICTCAFRRREELAWLVIVIQMSYAHRSIYVKTLLNDLRWAVIYLN